MDWLLFSGNTSRAEGDAMRFGIAGAEKSWPTIPCECGNAIDVEAGRAKIVASGHGQMLGWIGIGLSAAFIVAVVICLAIHLPSKTEPEDAWVWICLPAVLGPILASGWSRPMDLKAERYRTVTEKELLLAKREHIEAGMRRDAGAVGAGPATFKMSFNLWPWDSSGRGEDGMRRLLADLERVGKMTEEEKNEALDHLKHLDVQERWRISEAGQSGEDYTTTKAWFQLARSLEAGRRQDVIFLSGGPRSRRQPLAVRVTLETESDAQRCIEIFNATSTHLAEPPSAPGSGKEKRDGDGHPRTTG